MDTDIRILDSNSLRQFVELRQDAVNAVAARFQHQLGPEYAQYGARGRDACREDLAYHLEFLRPVLEFGIVQPMVDYLHWLTSVLDSRSVPSGHLALSLQWLSDYFSSAMGGEAGADIAIALGMVQARLTEADGAAPTATMLPAVTPESASFADMLLSGNREEASAIYRRVLSELDSMVDVAVTLVQPALYEVGRRWQNNMVTVAQEHLATAIAQSLMTEGLLRAHLPRPIGYKVLLACVEGNNHGVGLQMVADAFQLAGWEVQSLGTSVPTQALIAHTRQFRPDLLGLSVSFAHQLRAVKQVMAGLEEAFGAERPAVVIGGLAINQFNQLAHHLGADSWGKDAAVAVASADRLVPPRRAA